MTAAIGVLIVGSLLWDKKTHRERWRNQRLALENAIPVRAPIRYGRRSESRGNTYTMVFSKELDASAEKKGTGIFAPCEKHISCWDDLLEEALALWAAEQSSDRSVKKLGAKWGRVALLENPANPLEPRIVDDWVARTEYENTQGQLHHATSEGSVVTANGIFTISWPDGLPNEYSAILATATNPTIVNGRYPTAQTIADAWNSPNGFEYKEYFEKNQLSGITTFQDEDIRSALTHGSA